MRRIAALIIIIMMVVSALPAFADNVCGMTREEYRKKSLYNKVVDPIKDFKLKEKDKIKPLTMEKSNVFQDTANSIEKTK